MQCATENEKLEIGPEWLLPTSAESKIEEYEEIDVCANDDDEARLREYYKPNMANQAAFNENEHYGLNMAQKLNAVRAHQLQQNRLPVRFGLIYILLTH